MNTEQLAGFGGTSSRCGGVVHGGNGGGNAFKSNVLVGDDGSRIAVLLLNGRTRDGAGDERAAAAALRLFCAA
jgi:hypothetical protein